MIALITASGIFFTALQASINAPTDAFRACLRSANAKATAAKVAPDGIEAYFKAECSAQMDSLKSAVIAFRVKNGMGRKAAADDANMTVEDYVAAPADRYRFEAEMNAPAKADKPAEAAPAQAATAQPKS